MVPIRPEYIRGFDQPATHSQGRRRPDGIGHLAAPCDALVGRVGEVGGEKQEYDLAQSEIGSRHPPEGHGGVEQGDEADEGRLEA